MIILIIHASALFGKRGGPLPGTEAPESRPYPGERAAVLFARAEAAHEKTNAAPGKGAALVFLVLIHALRKAQMIREVPFMSSGLESPARSRKVGITS